MHSATRRFLCCVVIAFLLSPTLDAGAVTPEYPQQSDMVSMPASENVESGLINPVAEKESSDTDRELSLQISSELPISESGPTPEEERDILRLIYRTLTARDVQVDSQLALAEMLLLMQQDMGVLKRTGDCLGGSVPVVPPSVPVVTQLQPPALPLSTSVLEKMKALSSVVLAERQSLILSCSLVLLVLLLVLRYRRREKAKAESLTTYAPNPNVSDVTVLPSRFSESSPPVRDTGAVIQNEFPTQCIQSAPTVLAHSPTKENASEMKLEDIALSLGHVEGADAVLQECIESNPKEVLQRWIQLLETYRSNGMRDDFEELSSTLNQKFNVQRVQWDDVIPVDQLEMTLQLLPHIRDHIDATWGKPECLEYVQKLLYDNREGMRGGFSLSVVKELIFLVDLMDAEKNAE